jgi:hypothetical protein
VSGLLVRDPASDLLLVGRQSPTYLWVPPHDESREAEIVGLSSSAGLVLDPWQQLLVRLTSALDPFGRWLCFEVAGIVSRQNGKGGWLQSLELAWLFAFEEELVLHSAHLFETSREHFLKMKALVDNNYYFRRRVRRMREGRGSEEIELLHKSGSKTMQGPRLKFMTRKGGSGRGFTGSKIVCDEAMYLDATMMAAALPTLATIPNAQVVYAGSAGLRHSTQLGAVRRRALARNDPSLMYAEWAADKAIYDESGVLVAGDDPSSPVTWAKVNPAYNIRITPDYIGKEMRTLGGPNSVEFGTERLGIGDWPPDEEAWEVIDKEAWTAAADAGSQIVEGARIALAIGADPDRAMGTIGVCGLRGDGLRHVEIIERHRGTGWIVDATVNATKKPQVKATEDGVPPALKDWEQAIVDRMVDLKKRYTVCAIAVLKNSAAASLIGALTRAGLPVVSPSDTEYAAACGDLYEGIVDTHTVVHLDQPSGNAAMGGARKRELPEGGWRWSQSTAVDATPNSVHTLSLWAHTNYAKIPRSKVW